MTIPNARQYFLQQILAPTTITLGTVYLSIRNTATMNPMILGLKSITAQTLFAGTATSTGTLIGFQKVAAVPTGGSVVSPAFANPAAEPPDVEIRVANIGLTTVTANGQPFHHIGAASQLNSWTPPPLGPLDDENLYQFLPGQCLIAYAETAVVLGMRATVNIRWFQVT